MFCTIERVHNPFVLIFVLGQVASALQVKYADGEMERLGVQLFILLHVFSMLTVLSNLGIY